MTAEMLMNMKWFADPDTRLGAWSTALKTALGVGVLWLGMTGSSMAQTFICWNFSSSFSPAPSLKSDGAGGGKLLVSQTAGAGQVIYDGILTSSASCASTNNSYQTGLWGVAFTNPAFFAGGGLRIAATAAPTVTVPTNTWCHQPSPVQWTPLAVIVPMGTNTSVGCIVKAELPVRVTATGSTVVADSGFSTYMYAAASAGGSWTGPLATLSALPSACVLTPSVSTVTLPTVQQMQLNNAGDTAGVQPFVITLMGCSALATGAYVAKATWSFTPGATATTLANSATSPAANVEIQIRDATNTPVANNAVVTLASGITGGTYSANFSARYYATGQASAGNVRGVATFTLSYQ